MVIKKVVVFDNVALVVVRCVIGGKLGYFLELCIMIKVGFLWSVCVSAYFTVSVKMNYLRPKPKKCCSATVFCIPPIQKVKQICICYTI